MILVTVYDKKTATHSSVMSFRSLPDMHREFTTLFRKNPDHPYVNFPGDYSLQKHADFDPATGELIPWTAVKHICEVASYAENENP